MTTYSEHDQRILDQLSGTEMDKRITLTIAEIQSGYDRNHFGSDHKSPGVTAGAIDTAEIRKLLDDSRAMWSGSFIRPLLDEIDRLTLIIGRARASSK